MKNRNAYVLAFGALTLFAVAFATRYAVLRANLAAYDHDLPFTLESALQFRNVENVYTGAGIPAHDPDIQYPEGIHVFQTDTVLAEYVYGWMARLLPSSWPLPDRVRGIMLIWVSLGAPLLGWWVMVWTRSRTAGWIAGFFYAVSLASVIRASGLEVSRENFALPLLIAHLALDARAAFAPNPRRAAIGSAVCLGLALAAWDMIQFYTGLWALTIAVRAVKTGAFDTRTLWRVAAPGLALLFVALVVPYHRRHGVWMSPAMLLLVGAGMACSWSHLRNSTWWSRLFVSASPLALFVLGAGVYGTHYGHFGELLWAKLRFGNVKPVDPALLTFNQRIMWVPALDSASWELTWLLFPTILVLVLSGAVYVYLTRLRRPAKHDAPDRILWNAYVFFFCSSLIAYVLFVRFHVYVAVFAAALLGGIWAHALKRKSWAPYVLGPLLALGGMLEAARVWENPGRWGRPNVYVAELMELTEWLRDETERKPVLANFGLSAAILTYAGHPILLHPKFETPAIRERVQAYGEALFKGDEEAFRDWAETMGAAYYVYALGEFAQRSPELQMRYFVNALTPPDDAAARVFEERHTEVRFFEYLWGNRKYRIFRVISRADEVTADQLTIFAEQAFAEGDLAQAEEYAWAALALFPAQYRAREVVRHVASLREQGFTYEERVRDRE